MSLSKKDQIIIENHVMTTKGENNLILLNYNTGVYFGLDEMGSYYWELFKKFEVIEKVIGTILIEYKVEEEIVWNDIKNLVSTLLEKGLIKVKQNAKV